MLREDFCLIAVLCLTVVFSWAVPLWNHHLLYGVNEHLPLRSHVRESHRIIALCFCFGININDVYARLATLHSGNSVFSECEQDYSRWWYVGDKELYFLAVTGIWRILFFLPNLKNFHRSECENCLQGLERTFFLSFHMWKLTYLSHLVLAALPATFNCTLFSFSVMLVPWFLHCTEWSLSCRELLLAAN